MSLKRKITLQIAAMLIGLALVGGAGLQGLNGLRQDYGVALAGFGELRDVYGIVGSRVATARELLRSTPPDRAGAARQLHEAIDRLDLFLAAKQAGPAADLQDQQAENDIRSSLVAAIAQLDSTTPDPSDRALADAAAVERTMLRTASFAVRVGNIIEDRQRAAAARRRQTLLTLGALCAIVMAGEILLGIAHYRSVLRPLRELHSGVRRVAAGEFRGRLEPSGSREFRDLAVEFNRMADQIDEFYHRLEETIERKSRELIRSERLAGIGSLAAGVAHEINNPLGIIAGHAEYSLERLRRSPEATDAEMTESLKVICDEAFRCKEITDRLLSLVRPGENHRVEVDLGRVAREVVAAVRGLRDFQDRSLIVQTPRQADVRVTAVEAEMKQVLLNLTINALQAVRPGGEVRLDVTRSGDLVELRVRDNGRGMTPEVLDRVFEPFFTDRRGTGRPGTGLGLSITHAIVLSCGGRIDAASAGPDCGSEFVVRIPATEATR